VANEDGLHAIDCFDTDDFSVGHDHQLPVSRIRCSSNGAAEPLCRPCVGGQHDENALSSPNGNDGRINHRFCVSGYDNIDGKAHGA
jgi:hypothetical protein